MTIDKSEEQMSIDPDTGARKGKKLEMFHLIPFDFLWALARHYGVGAQKYDDRNWEKGLRWSLIYNSMQRHIGQFVSGERLDKETGSHHLVCAAWHIIALWWYDNHRKGTDDLVVKRRRIRKKKAPKKSPVGASKQSEVSDHDRDI